MIGGGDKQCPALLILEKAIYILPVSTSDYAERGVLMREDLVWQICMYFLIIILLSIARHERTVVRLVPIGEQKHIYKSPHMISVGWCRLPLNKKMLSDHTRSTMH